MPFERAGARCNILGVVVTSMGGKLVRTIGLARVRTKIGLQNSTYNIKRFIYLRGTRAVAAV